MWTDPWIVKTSGGHEWGFVKRLVINSATRQISHADIILADTGRLIRLPWESFEVCTEGIKLAISEAHIQAGGWSSDGRVGEHVSMEVWP